MAKVIISCAEGLHAPQREVGEWVYSKFTGLPFRVEHAFERAQSRVTIPSVAESSGRR
jgi:hypothetical protein